MKFPSLAVAALVLIGSAVAATAAAPFRMFEIFAVRYVNDVQTGAVLADLGAYNALGEFRHHSYLQGSPGMTIPAEVMNKPLLPFSMWPAYDVLGRDALANFKLDSVLIGGAGYWMLSIADQAKVNVGPLLNISARGVISPAGEPLIGGFVIDERPRRVLIRAIGPTLKNFDVAAPLANPMITIFRQGVTAAIAVNDDWGQQPNAAEIESTAVAVGAFALSRDSKDAALVIQLDPGAYTAQLTSADGTGGSALLEVYVVP